LKILYISSARSLGGGERHLADLANGMTIRGHEVFVALRPGSPLMSELSELPKQNLLTLPLRNALDAKSARELAKVVSRAKIQIVHAHMARDYPLAAFATRKSPWARLIVTRHVLFALNRLHRLTLSRARIIAVSQAVATELSNSNVVSAEKISVVHNGIDAARFADARNNFNRGQFLHEWNLPVGSLVIGTVGELTPLKGQAEFLKAASTVAQHYPHAYFIIAGTDHSQSQTNKAALQELINQFNLGDRVRTVSWVKDISKIYCALDVFVSASHTESFGLAIAEAMACATPVIATETGGAKELIEQQKTGVLVPVGDVERLSKAILMLLGDESTRIELGRAAQHSIAENFGLSKMLDRTEEIYREALSR
jgi:glycosyltransferase involved in cell wall biosynthesis